MKDYRIKRALKFIDENLDKDLTLHKVAQRFNLSKSYFCQLFKKEANILFSKYLIKTRIKKAKKFLRNSSLSVKEISCKVSYKYVSNFYHDFKKETGLTPLEYKKGHLKIILLKLKQFTAKVKELINSI
jgi:two-component system response regulator YesN